MYVIQRTDVPLYFNEEKGWVGFDDADYYKKNEGKLPDDEPCAWCPLWSIDAFQFARLLAEIHMTGAVDTEGIKLLADSMGLERDQIDGLFERALEVWEQSKEKLP